jgi:stearoyl-CoA desaturase (delta-9 desaturase)|tara:strand:- start:7595 stop:8254 length:660 start_codon:yes stop_codon:yes gene_type:complete
MSWWLVILLGFIWSTVISHLGASILLHRFYCHKQLEVPVWFELLGLAMLMIAVIRTPIGWIASHRMHHAYSDTKDDPHSPSHTGFLQVLFTTWTITTIPLKFAKDLYRNPRLVFCHKHWLKIWIGVWVVTIIISPKLFVAFALMPFIHAKIGFGLLNTVCHYPVPRNVPTLNLLIAGEGYHRNHHANFRRLRLHKFDTGGWLAEKMIAWGIFKPTTGPR